MHIFVYNYRQGCANTSLLLGEKHSLKNREMHVHDNDTVNTESDTVNDTVFLLIRENNKITASEISKRLKMSLSTVKRKIKELIREW